MQKVFLLTNLPVDLNRGIGRIVSAHALLELHLEACVGSLCGLGHKERRIALAGERTETRLQTIKLLLQIHNLKVAIPAELTPSKLKTAREERNLLAHGTWSKMPSGRYAVIQTAGAWPQESGLGSRKIKPAGVLTDATALAAVLHVITGLRMAAEELRDRVNAALEASPRTPQ